MESGGIGCDICSTRCCISALEAAFCREIQLAAYGEVVDREVTVVYEICISGNSPAEAVDIQLQRLAVAAGIAVKRIDFGFLASDDCICAGCSGSRR